MTRTALERIFAETTLPICAHCEDEATVRANAARLRRHDATSPTIRRIRDHAAAVIATRRAIDLALRHSIAFMCCMFRRATKRDLLADHRDLITAEACPHHLFFNIDDYARLGTLVQMNPSLKTADDNGRLWQALADGRIQVIATDHAPHTLEEKQQPYPAVAFGPAGGGELAGADAQRGPPRPLHAASKSSTGCATPRPASGTSSTRAASPSATTPTWCSSICTNRARSATKSNSPNAAGARGTASTLTGWPVRTWVHGEEVFRDGVERRSPRPRSPVRPRPRRVLELAI